MIKQSREKEENLVEERRFFALKMSTQHTHKHDTGCVRTVLKLLIHAWEFFPQPNVLNMLPHVQNQNKVKISVSLRHFRYRENLEKKI